MKLPSMMSWVGVRPRVFGGFALVLSFLVLLGGFAMVQVERIGGTVNELVTSAAGDAGMSQVRAALLSANGAVEKFIRTWNVGDRDAATQAIARVGKLTDQVERQFGKLQPSRKASARSRHRWKPTGLLSRPRRRPSTGCVRRRQKPTPRRGRRA